MTLATDLDGTYTVTSLTSYQGPLQKQSDGITTIEGGETFRVDEAGCEWRSTFEWMADDQVKMTSVADPKNARKDFLLVGANGLPTAEPQTYESVMTVKRKGDKVQMTGTIQYGNETVFLTMRKM
jgi:hypothetical protein